MEDKGERPLNLYKSELPAILVAAALEIVSSPRINFLISSRNFPFHSHQRFPPGNPPSWYHPPQSQGSAIIFVLARIGSSFIA